MEAFLEQNLWILLLVALWTLPWKGYAMWQAARIRDRNWFIAFLLLNTLAILEIAYIFFVLPRKKVGEGEAE